MADKDTSAITSRGKIMINTTIPIHSERATCINTCTVETRIIVAYSSTIHHEGAIRANKYATALTHNLVVTSN